MKKNLLFGLMVFLAGSLASAAAAPKEDVQNAAKKLGAGANYSWTTTVKVPEGSRWRPGPSEGKTAKDGLTWLKMTFGDNTTEVVLKGKQGAVKTSDADWRSVDELNNADGRGRFLGTMLRNFKSPAEQAVDIVADTKELKRDGDLYAGDLTEDGAKTLLIFRGWRNGEGPNVSNAKGSAKFWVKDGMLTKMEYEVSGKISFNGNDRDVERTTTVEIKDIGSTQIEVPADAKKKLEGESKPDSTAPEKK